MSTCRPGCRNSWWMLFHNFLTWAEIIFRSWLSRIDCISNHNTILLQLCSEPEGGTHPCFAVDIGLLLQDELHHLDVAIVTPYMERGVTHLRVEREIIETEKSSMSYSIIVICIILTTFWSHYVDLILFVVTHVKYYINWSNSNAQKLLFWKVVIPPEIL